MSSVLCDVDGMPLVLDDVGDIGDVAGMAIAMLALCCCWWPPPLPPPLGGARCGLDLWLVCDLKLEGECGLIEIVSNRIMYTMKTSTE